MRRFLIPIFLLALLATDLQARGHRSRGRLRHRERAVSVQRHHDGGGFGQRARGGLNATAPAECRGGRCR